MSGVSTQGVGAAACANAEGVSAAGAVATKSAAVIKIVLPENLVILRSPRNRSEGRHQFLEQTTNGNRSSIWQAVLPRHASPDFVISRFRLRDYVRALAACRATCRNNCARSHVLKIRHRDDSDEPRDEDLLGSRLVDGDAGSFCPGR